MFLDRALDVIDWKEKETDRQTEEKRSLRLSETDCVRPEAKEKNSQ